ncbi:MAG: T9SS type A sorting domain-containing protein [Bacteroidia bacterium]
MKKFILISLALLFKTASAQLCFSPPFNQQVVSNCNSVITDDFNQDGFADVATVSGAANSVSVLFGTGLGNMTNLDSTVVDSLPYMLTSADFNNDGYPDIATSNYTDRSVSILLNNGAGTFTGAVSYNAVINYTIGYGTYAITTGDFNGDSNIDIAVANSTGLGSFSILLGNGAGVFGPPTGFVIGNQPVSIISADFNNDGIADIACTHYSPSKVSISLGNGSGGFISPGSFAAGSNAESVSAADFNGDSNLDLAVANFGSSNISVLLGDGTGGFIFQTNYPAGNHPFCVITGDFNNDLKTDIATANMLSSDISIILGTGTGSFSSTYNFPAGAQPHSLVTADFNMDGKADIATGNWQATNTSILLSCLVTDIKPNNTISEVLVYPNPTNGLFKITSPEKQTVQLYDITGKLVLNKIINGSADIDASELENGVYLLTIKNNAGISNQKLIITR